MSSELLLLKMGELALKALNRHTFEEVLAKNLRRKLKPLGAFTLERAQSAMTIAPRDDAFDLEEAQARVARTFGVAAFSRAKACDKSLTAIQALAGEYLAEALGAVRTFKVEARRSDKKFPLSSPEICREVGAYLLERLPHLKVDVHNPDLTVHVEVRDNAAFVHGPQQPGAGGMPIGTGGRAALLLSGGIDSPVAGWMMAKRGVQLVPVHFVSPPYTSERAEDKVRALCAKLRLYTGTLPLHILNFTRIQETIARECPEELFTLIMRRFMMRLACEVARRQDCGALITGESVGQVASQTLPALACTEAVCAAYGLPVLRPVVGMDKEEIIAIARRIDTFETSIEPYQDCCTVFTPRHPRTNPKLEQLLEAEASLDADALCAQALAGVRVERVSRS